MRTWFEPEEAEEFEAAKDLLIRRCVTWAEEQTTWSIPPGGLPAQRFVMSKT